MPPQALAEAAVK